MKGFNGLLLIMCKVRLYALSHSMMQLMHSGQMSFISHIEIQRGSITGLHWSSEWMEI